MTHHNQTKELTTWFLMLEDEVECTQAFLSYLRELGIVLDAHHALVDHDAINLHDLLQ
jgi:hypothetical protein